MRDFAYDISGDIMARWSPRAFSTESIPENDLAALLEAARYAPSCFNEQPWRFLLATRPDERKALCDCLSAGNQVWACKAPAFVVILSKLGFGAGLRPNYWHMFDAGASWGFLALEAQRRGLVTHAMGGFDRDKVRQVFDISAEVAVITVVAIGKYGDPSRLPHDLREREKPGMRKPLSDILIKPGFETP